MVAGMAYGYFAVQGESTDHVRTWIKPIGDMFLRLLRMIAVPLVLFSLIAGVASLNDTAKLARIGGKTIGLYIGTTAIAITIGLVVVNVIRPGANTSPEFRRTMLQGLEERGGEKLAAAQANAEKLDLGQQFLNMVPENPFEALVKPEMLQVVFFALLLGFALTRLPKGRSKPVVTFFDTMSDAIIAMVQMIMIVAPLGVFALLATTVAEFGGSQGTNADDALGELVTVLGVYMGTVLLGLVLHFLLVYTVLLKFIAKVPLKRFMKAMVPAQLLAFSSSSSGATLPVTMECVEEGVGVDEEVSSFVLPLGATVNMDGTGLYQAVAAVFIATIYSHDLTMGDQLAIVLTATLASIGTAAVPGVGLVMLIIVLQQIGVAPAGIALILGVDRPLDMCRTVLNVTGDATIATTVAATEGLLHDPETHSNIEDA